MPAASSWSPVTAVRLIGVFCTVELKRWAVTTTSARPPSSVSAATAICDAYAANHTPAHARTMIERMLSGYLYY
jgi:hypothetical protein